MRRLRRILLATAFGVALAPFARPDAAERLAFAQQQPSDADKATARELAQDGQAALDKKDYKTAEDRFRRADQIYHATTLALGLARAQAGLGKLLEAQETYNRIIREGAPPGSPPAFAAAVADARREVDPIASRLATIVINVTGADNPHVTLDDQPVPNAVLGVKRPVNPGTHVVKATADGYLPAQQNVTVDEKGSTSASLTLQKDPNAPPPVAAGAGAGAGGTPANGASGAPGAGSTSPPGGEPGGGDHGAASGGGSTQKTLGFVALGVGAAGLIVGGVTGALALGKHGSLSDTCANGTCPPSAQSDLDSYHSMATLSTVGFIVGGVGVAAGVVLLLTAPSAKATTAAATRFIRPYAGPGSVGAYGRF